MGVNPEERRKRQEDAAKEEGRPFRAKGPQPRQPTPTRSSAPLRRHCRATTCRRHLRVRLPRAPPWPQRPCSQSRPAPAVAPAPVDTSAATAVAFEASTSYKKLYEQLLEHYYFAKKHHVEQTIVLKDVINVQAGAKSATCSQSFMFSFKQTYEKILSQFPQIFGDLRQGWRRESQILRCCRPSCKKREVS